MRPPRNQLPESFGGNPPAQVREKTLQNPVRAGKTAINPPQKYLRDFHDHDNVKQIFPAYESSSEKYYGYNGPVVSERNML